MSVVTNVIIKTLFDEVEAISHVNEWLKKHHRADQRLFEPLGLEVYTAGTKAMECELFLGAFNHLEVAPFTQACKSAPWGDFDTVQVLVQKQDDDLFQDVLRERE